ncbi:MAG TPA: hypothetical protein PLT20_11915, partial [Sedimentisphaerales bacterium]|nr:hypothetical protein [Sedimentisphaerales bacterium]
MRRISRTTSVVFILWSGWVLPALGDSTSPGLLHTQAGDDSIVTLEPRPREGMLLNPGKGWSVSGSPQRQPQEV